jgi:tRNA-modifying protein YgfZ
MNSMNPVYHLPLSHLGLIRASGEDAPSLLQGQLSNDVRALSEQQAQLSSLNSPKGRMLAVLQLFLHEAHIHLQMDRRVLDDTLKRLRLFILRSRVTLELAPLTGLGVYGAGAPDWLRAAGLPAPEAAFARADARGISLIRQPGDQPRYVLWGEAQALTALPTCPAGTANDWCLQDIACGLPTILPETRDEFVPQMCNLDLLGGISFNKGCYTGQEIVARLHYLGQIKRRMFACRAAGSPPLPGAPLYAHGAPEPVGSVVQAAVCAQGSSAFSAVLQLRALEGTPDLRLGTPEGPPVNVDTATGTSAT